MSDNTTKPVTVTTREISREEQARRLAAAQKPKPAEGQRWSYPTHGRGPERSIATLIRPYAGRAWRAMTGHTHTEIVIDPQHDDIRFESTDWFLWLPKGDLPALECGRPDVGQIWAVGSYGMRMVVAIEQVDPENFCVKAVVHAAGGKLDPAVMVGKVVELSDSLLQARLVGDDPRTPICAPDEFHAGPGLPDNGCGMLEAAARLMGQACGTALEILAESFPATTTPAQLDAFATKATYEAPTLTQVHARREVSTNSGRDWCRYELLGDDRPFATFEYRRVLGPHGQWLTPVRVAPPAPAPLGTCSDDSCDDPALHIFGRQRTPFCTNHYLQQESTVGNSAAYVGEGYRATIRLRKGRYSDMFGDPDPSPRACSPTLFGGVWNIGR